MVNGRVSSSNSYDALADGFAGCNRGKITGRTASGSVSSVSTVLSLFKWNGFNVKLP
jgi:hypothetical protein